MAGACLGLLGGGALGQTIIAYDTADNAAYDSGWADDSNGGFGFGGWTFASSVSDGYAGRFIANETNDGPSNVLNGNPGRAWALYANNGSGTEQSAAFRGLDAAIGGAGTMLEIAMESGFIGDGGRVGVSLRTGNADGSYADVDTGAVTQVYFEGGDANFTVLDALGEHDTGAGFGFDGVVARFMFTGGGMFDLQIDRYYNESGDYDTFMVSGLTLGGSGVVESIALFSDDGGDGGGLNNDVYFNNLTITVPAPGAAAALVVAGFVGVRRRR